MGGHTMKEIEARAHRFQKKQESTWLGKSMEHFWQSHSGNWKHAMHFGETAEPAQKR